MNRKVIITIGALVLIAVGVFFYFFVPGSWIGGIDDISAESSVYITQTIWTLDNTLSALPPTPTDTIYKLNAEQIEMLKDYIRGSVFTRTLRTVLYHQRNEKIYSTYEISIHDDNFIAAHDTVGISISGGYVTGFKQSGNGWLKINNSTWEESLLKILALSS